MGGRWIELRGEIGFFSQVDKAFRCLTLIGLSILICKPVQAVTANIQVITNLVNCMTTLFTYNQSNRFDQVDTMRQYLADLRGIDQSRGHPQFGQTNYTGNQLRTVLDHDSNNITFLGSQG